MVLLSCSGTFRSIYAKLANRPTPHKRTAFLPRRAIPPTHSMRIGPRCRVGISSSAALNSRDAARPTPDGFRRRASRRPSHASAIGTSWAFVGRRVGLRSGLCSMRAFTSGVKRHKLFQCPRSAVRVDNSAAAFVTPATRHLAKRELAAGALQKWADEARRPEKTYERLSNRP
jgi:hypothetical protein